MSWAISLMMASRRHRIVPSMGGLAPAFSSHCRDGLFSELAGCSYITTLVLIDQGWRIQNLTTVALVCLPKIWPVSQLLINNPTSHPLGTMQGAWFVPGDIIFGRILHVVQSIRRPMIGIKLIWRRPLRHKCQAIHPLPRWFDSYEVLSGLRTAFFDTLLNCHERWLSRPLWRMDSLSKLFIYLLHQTLRFKLTNL